MTISEKAPTAHASFTVHFRYWHGRREVTDYCWQQEHDYYAQRIEPWLGRLSLPKITQPVLRQWVATQLHSGIGNETLRKCESIVRQVLQQAVDDGLLRGNAMHALDPGRTRRPAITPVLPDQVLSSAQLDQLAAAMGARHRCFGSMILVMGRLGATWAETLGLQPGDLDVVAGRLRLGRATRVEQQGRIGTPTQRGATKRVRSVRLDDDLLVQLDDLAQQVRRDGGVWLFTTAQGCDPKRSNWNELYFRPALRALDLPDLSSKDLRHTAAALALAGGSSMEQVRDMLGHSRTLTTSCYYRAFVPPPALAGDLL